VDPAGTQFHILSLDGGGIKGIFSAAVLASLENTLKTRIIDHFDLITGTSTGGIIAIGLGLGMSPKELVQFYVNHGPRIFRNTLWWRSVLRVFRSKFSPANLEAGLRNQHAFGEKRLGDSTKRLVIPSFSLHKNDVRLFKTPHHKRLRTDWQLPAWQVAMATSAAPTYFPAYQQIDSLRLVDGGLWANNPTMVGLTEAVSLLGIPMSSIRILSVGTCSDLVQHDRRLNCGGLWRWRRAGIEVALRGQSLGAVNQAKLLLGEDNVHRLDPPVPADVFKLDKLNVEDLIAEAAHASLHFGPQFETMFLPHRAAPYTPLCPEQAAEEKR
jgi:patatin-like phospholipase/acyl hydrolase